MYMMAVSIREVGIVMIHLCDHESRDIESTVREQLSKAEEMKSKIIQIHGFYLKAEMYFKYFLSDKMGETTRKDGSIKNNLTLKKCLKVSSTLFPGGYC